MHEPEGTGQPERRREDQQVGAPQHEAASVTVAAIAVARTIAPVTRQPFMARASRPPISRAVGVGTLESRPATTLEPDTSVIHSSGFTLIRGRGRPVPRS